MKEYNAVETLSDDERAKLTFAESLDYYLRLPANATKRNKSLISDRQYIDLLHQCTGNQTVAEQMREREQVDVTWLYNQVKAATYRRVDMDFKVADDRTDSGPVLVTFVEPADGKGESYKRRHPSSRDQLTLSMMRRCIPYSQLQAAIELGHIGPLGVGHVGQDNTYINCSRLFDGVSRHLVRDYVKRCSVCQSKQTQQHQSAVKPLVSKALWERVVMDLVDFGESRRSRGFRYIWHAQDHFSKFNFVAPLMHKTADEVAGAVEAMLRVTGPIKILQCDNGTEFKGRVLDVCKEWKMDPPTHSSPYHPQTNGLIERAGSTLKTALDKWAEQFNTREWADAGTKLAAQKWRAAKADGSERLELARQNKRKAGGSWKEQRCTTEAVLVPRVMVASQPFVVLFHRSQIEYHHKKRRNNTEFGVSSGGSGHYEALMANTAEPGQRALYDGMHWPDSPLHYHLLHIGNCYLAAQFNDLARVRMVRDDRGNDSASFKVPNAVGLRVGALTPVNRRGHTTALDIMPCIIVRVIGGDSSSTSSGAQPAKYKLLTPFGVLKGTFRVEDLVTVTLNSHPPLLELFNSFTAEELMAPTALGAQPIDLSRWGEITVDEAWAQTNSGKQPAAVDNSRRREVAPRTAAVAAETAIVSSLEEHRHAPSLFTTSSQAAPPPAAPSRAPFILRFVAINRAGDKFKAVWSDPPDHWTWETKTSVYKQGEAAWQLLEEYLDSTELDVSNVA